MNMKIYLCDDNQSDLMQYAAYLETLCEKHGITLKLKSYHSAAALLFAAENPKRFPDLIFIDIGAPNMNGAIAAKELRRMGYSSDFIFLSQSIEHFSVAFDVGALHYIVKGKTNALQFEDVFFKAIASAKQKIRRLLLQRQNTQHSVKQHLILRNSPRHGNGALQRNRNLPICTG